MHSLAPVLMSVFGTGYKNRGYLFVQEIFVVSFNTMLLFINTENNTDRKR